MCELRVCVAYVCFVFTLSLKYIWSLAVFFTIQNWFFIHFCYFHLMCQSKSKIWVELFRSDNGVNDLIKYFKIHSTRSAVGLVSSYDILIIYDLLRWPIDLICVRICFCVSNNDNEIKLQSWILDIYAIGGQKFLETAALYKGHIKLYIRIMIIMFVKLLCKTMMINKRLSFVLFFFLLKFEYFMVQNLRS